MNLRKIFRSSFPLLIFIFVFIATFSFLMLRDTKETSATSLANFKAGNIISDYVMSNYTSMSESEIQKFLESKVTCNNTDYSIVEKYTTATVKFHFKDSHFVCLPEETFGEGTKYGEDAKDGESAAHIIYQAAQEYKINPQVIIVLLQKEQGLITDNFPNSYQYRSATGYGCPDTAACDSKYYGFKNQVNNAARLFRAVLDGGWTNYPLGKNYIQYNPSSACGGSEVYIENLATSALYRYTPYQPNAAALAAGYGTAPCGAYGNRNFYLYFSDWFGDSTATYTVSDSQKTAQTKIDDYYASLSSASEKLGNKTTIYPNCNIGHANSCVQAYQKGVIISSDFGTWENYGEIRNTFVKNKSVDGVLGFPTSGLNCSLTRKDSCVQTFEKGIIIYNKSLGAFAIPNEIYLRYKELGSDLSALGYPTANINCNIGHKDSCVQAFEKGVIISNPKTGTWESYGEIRSRFLNNGSVDGYFGFPTSEVFCNNLNHCSQVFENGAIFEDINGKFWVSNFSIVSRYYSEGIADKLGQSLSNINCNIGHKDSCVQAFEKGVIISNPKTGTWESYGEPRSKHLSLGSIDGSLGFPISGVRVINSSETQEFEGGTL